MTLEKLEGGHLESHSHGCSFALLASRQMERPNRMVSWTLLSQLFTKDSKRESGLPGRRGC